MPVGFAYLRGTYEPVGAAAGCDLFLSWPSGLLQNQKQDQKIAGFASSYTPARRYSVRAISSFMTSLEPP
jgi:hypothetical protein